MKLIDAKFLAEMYERAVESERKRVQRASVRLHVKSCVREKDIMVCKCLKECGIPSRY